MWQELQALHFLSLPFFHFATGCVTRRSIACCHYCMRAGGHSGALASFLDSFLAEDLTEEQAKMLLECEKLSL